LKSKLNYVDSQLKNFKKYNLYRQMRDSKITGPHIIFNSKTLINLCSNDYLGLTQSKISNSQNQSSSRLIAGNDNSFKTLEEKLSKHKSQDSTLIFPTGYMANLGVISSLIEKNECYIFTY